MNKTTSSIFDEDAPILRFEESDDFQAHSSRVNYHNSTSYAGNSTPSDDPYAELKQKQEALLKMRQDLEKTQREAEELEARRQKEERFSDGRREISEKLARTLARLERELYNAQKAIEEISSARDSYQQHLDALQEIHPETWNRNALDDHLDRAIGAVEDAEEDFAKTSRRLSVVLTERGSAGAVAVGAPGALPTTFQDWARCGFAFTLPLIATVVVALLIIKLLF